MKLEELVDEMLILRCIENFCFEILFFFFSEYMNGL